MSFLIFVKTTGVLVMIDYESLVQVHEPCRMITLCWFKSSSCYVILVIYRETRESLRLDRRHAL
jgi:hypothetical protein